MGNSHFHGSKRRRSQASPPVNGQGEGGPYIIWSNKLWDELTGGGDLKDVVDKRSYDVLRSQISKPGSPSNILNLALSRPLVTLRFAQTFHAPPSSSTSPSSPYHILTCLEDTSAIRTHHRRRSSPSYRTGSPSPFFLGAAEQSLSSSPDKSPRPAFTPQTTDCRQLLELTDWSKTSLGPRETWSPVIETMISVIMASPTQDALWLGPEFNMI